MKVIGKQEMGAYSVQKAGPKYGWAGNITMVKTNFGCDFYCVLKLTWKSHCN